MDTQMLAQRDARLTRANNERVYFFNGHVVSPKLQA